VADPQRSWRTRPTGLAAAVLVGLLVVACRGVGLEGSAAATGTTTAPTAALSPIGAVTRARVVRVVDGDTIVVRIGGAEERVRYIGMDTPESVKPDTPIQPMAEEAAAANRALVEGQEVMLEREISDRDRFDRLLRDVWVDRDGTLVLVGLELVRDGFAQVATFPPDVAYVQELLAAQRQARADGVGLWADH